MASYKDHKWLMEGEILIYILSTSTNDIWQVRFLNPMGRKPRYIRKSTKHKSEALATAFAVDLFNDYRSRALLNLKTEKTTIAYLIEKYSHQFDAVTLKMMNGLNKSYWQRYIKDDDISLYTSDDIEKYFKWRIQDKLNRQALEDKGEKHTKYWRSSEDSISASTLKLERNIMRKLFEVGYKFNYIARIPSFPERFDRMDNVHKLPSNKRRGRFHPVNDYQRIVLPYLRSIYNGLNKPQYTPILENPDKPFNEETNRWRSINSFRNRDRELRDKPITDAQKIYGHTYDRYHHAHFWFASLLIANSGIRPSACHKLRHRDIKLVKDNDGKVYTLINIDQSISKTGKSRVVVCRDFHKTFERYIIFKQEIEYRFNRTITDDHYIFPNTNQKNPYQGHRKKYDGVFRPHFQRMGLHKRELEEYPGVHVFFSAYSFRSFYISERLKNGLDLYTLSKNVGSSPKTILTAYDYNENWEFRRQITQHYKAEPSSDCPGELEDYLSTSSLFS